jgi:hypothetical protein
MMTLAKMAVAALLLAWFVWKARQNRLFLLGLPVLMVMGESVFFDLMRPFWTPGRLESQTHIMIWLTIVWGVIVFRRGGSGGRVSPFGPGRLLPEEVPLLILAAIVGAHVLGAAAPYGDIGGALTTAADLIYLLAGYVLVRGIVSRFSREQVIEFLTAVVLANTLAAALYVMHQGLGFKIYTGGEYFTTTFGGAEITRTFHFAPMFTLLALGFVLARSAWTPRWLAVLAVTVSSVLVSYTRTLLIAVAVALVLAIFVRELKNGDAGRLLRRSLVVLVSLALVFAVFSVALPAQSAYVVSRMSEFATAGGLGDIGNWEVRQFKYGTIADYVTRSDVFFGIGFPPAGSNPVDGLVYRYSADMAWIPIVYYTGYVGLALVGLALFGFVLRALRMAMLGSEERRYLGLTYFIVIVLTTLVSFTAWTFMQPQIAPMGLWFFAFVAAEALRQEPQLAAAPLLDAAAETAARRVVL